MVWQWLHRFLGWAPVTLATAYIAVFTAAAAAAATNNTASRFVDKQIEFWRSAVSYGWVPWVLFAVATVVWLGAFLWTGLHAERAGSRRDLARDEALASRAEDLARDMMSEQATMNRTRMQRHWRDETGDNSTNYWLAGRREEAVEHEAAAKRFNFRLQSILSELEQRGVRVDAWGVDQWGAEELGYWAKALSLVSASARAGTYAGKVLKVYHYEQVLGTPDEFAQREAASR
jgi:hypothetical protein